MSGLETIALVAGTALSAAGAIQQGKAQEAALKAQAQAQEARAKEERAVASREAAKRAERAKQVLSRQQAVAAASGAGATDKTVLDIMSETAAEGDVQSRTALYEGEMRGRGLEYQAAIDRMNARQAKLSGFINAGSTVLSGVGSYYDMKRKNFSSGSTMPTLAFG